MTEITLSWSAYNGGKGWLARVTGTDPKFGLAREFVRAVERHSSRSGATGTSAYILGDGLYESSDRDGRSYLQVKDGVLRSIDRAELVDLLTRS